MRMSKLAVLVPTSTFWVGWRFLFDLRPPAEFVGFEGLKTWDPQQGIDSQVTTTFRVEQSIGNSLWDLHSSETDGLSCPSELTSRWGEDDRDNTEDDEEASSSSDEGWAVLSVETGEFFSLWTHGLSFVDVSLLGSLWALSGKGEVCCLKKFW